MDNSSKPEVKLIPNRMTSPNNESKSEERNGSSQPPEKCEGFLMKRKKWPRKGWHKRYFHLESGLLRYAKTPNALKKNKLHGKMDVSLCVMSHKKTSFTIDLDAEDTIFHIKANSMASYQQWVSSLRAHRDFRSPKKDSTLTNTTISSPVVEEDGGGGLEITFEGIPASSGSSTKELMQAQIGLQKLSKILKEVNSSSCFFGTQSPAPTPTKKERKHSKKSAKKSQKGSTTSFGSETSSSRSQHASSNSVCQGSISSDPQFKVPKTQYLEASNIMSYSHPDLTSLTANHTKDNQPDQTKQIKSNQTTPTRPSALSVPTFNETMIFSSGSDALNLFLSAASEVYQLLMTSCEKLNQREQESKKESIKDGKINLQQLISENKSLKSRLERIHAESALPASVDESWTHTGNREKTSLRRSKPINQKTQVPLLTQLSSESQLSINESTSELFYDAEEYFLSGGESSSESEAESETNDDFSTDEASEQDGSECPSASDDTLTNASRNTRPPIKGSTGRRQRLPCPRASQSLGMSIWSVMRRHIGKDLSKVSMPVEFNEPLNTLQHLCEELEYSDLLDKASLCDDKFDRMVFIAAFAVSSYGSTYHRAGQKPFNPLLGETYECIREDRGFRFVAEQVSHHPPISACHCDSNNFEFWQDSHYKTKFYGKSMEMLPMGKVNVLLKSHETVYTWNKLTSCLHNIFSASRWIEHYGTVNISGGDVTCRLNFSKGSYFSSKIGDISGEVCGPDGQVVRTLHGRWYEGIYCGQGSKSHCVWRTGAMPPGYEQYYGFTRFATELNEMEPGLEALLPRTDTRLRPDQRMLEEGDIEGAEKEKCRVENLQRERRKNRDAIGALHEPLFFCKISDAEGDSWIFKGDYWKLRREPGFQNLTEVPQLW